MKNLILFLCLVISACAGSKTTVTETKERIETYTTTSEVKLDTTLFITNEKVSLFIPVEKAKINRYVNPKVYTQQNGRARVTISIDSTGIKATANCDSISKRLNYFKREVKQLRLQVTDKKNTTKEKRGYSLAELILYIFVATSVGFVAAYLLKTFRIL